VIQPWEFQDEKANVCMRYTKTQSLYLSRKGVLPEIVDLFGMNRGDEVDQFDEEAPPLDLESEGDEDEPTEEVEEPIKDDGYEDEIDSFFG
jgi:hypothetical protein